MPANTNSKSKIKKEAIPKRSFFEKLFGIKKNAVEKEPAKNITKLGIEIKKIKKTAAKIKKTKAAKKTPRKKINNSISPQENVITENILKKTPKKTSKKKKTTAKTSIKKIVGQTPAPSKKNKIVTLKKSEKNPIIAPNKENKWESYQTFNPAAVIENGKVHLLYRALGEDGVSRIGYAISENGVDIEERLSKPIFTYHSEFTKRESVSMPDWYHNYSSGGSWNGSEDPRITKIDDKIYMCFVAFDGYNEPSIAITHIKLKDFLNRKWKWAGVKIISKPGIIDKSACVFPEKIKGKYVIMHRIFPNILIDFVDSLDFKPGEHLKGEYQIKIRKDKWDSRKIGAGAPPIKTKHGWLLIYYAVDDKDDSKYKTGAMLLDLNDPTKVLYRTDEPILEPVEWYENNGHKFGVIYPCGAVVVKGKLIIYYGGADSYVCAATAKLETFLKELMTTKKPKLKKVKAKK